MGLDFFLILGNYYITVKSLSNLSIIFKSLGPGPGLGFEMCCKTLLTEGAVALLHRLRCMLLRGHQASSRIIKWTREAVVAPQTVVPPGRSRQIHSCFKWHLMAWAAEPLDYFQLDFVEPGGLECSDGCFSSSVRWRIRGGPGGSEPAALRIARINEDLAELQALVGLPSTVPPKDMLEISVRDMDAQQVKR